MTSLLFSQGNLYCLNDSREKIVDAIEEAFGEAYIKAIWKDYGNALDELYIQYPKWKSDAVFNDLCNLFIKYYEQYEIYISETSEGTYYDIPVRL